MNAAFLLMSSAFVAGADAPPAAPVAAAPAAHVAPCCAIPAPCSDGCARRGLFAHLKGWGHRHDCDACGRKHDCNTCGHKRDHCATPCATHHVFHGFTTAAHCGGCDACGVERHGWGSGPGLLSRLKAKFGHNGCCEAPCGVAGGCALPPVPGGPVPAAPGAPEKMPAPGKGTTKDPKGSAQVVPGLSPVAAGTSPF